MEKISHESLDHDAYFRLYIEIRREKRFQAVIGQLTVGQLASY